MQSPPRPDEAGAPARLTPDDYDALDAELDLMREQDDSVPQWEFCDGFLAALVCTRRPVSPEEYWPVLLGEHFSSVKYMNFAWNWKRRWLETETGLDAEVESLEDERAWQPEVLDTRGALLALPPEERDLPVDGELPSFGQVWALGFLAAVEHWGEEWAPPRDREAAEILEESLDAVAALAQDDPGPYVVSMYEEHGAPSVSQQRVEAFGDAVWAVYDLRRLWRSLGPRVASVRREATVGRNDPCPCGSGRKFKKCCGA